MKSRGKPQSTSALFLKRAGFLCISSYASSPRTATAARARHDSKCHRRAPRQEQGRGKRALPSPRHGEPVPGRWLRLGSTGEPSPELERARGPAQTRRLRQPPWLSSHGRGSPARRHRACGAEVHGGGVRSGTEGRLCPLLPWPGLRLRAQTRNPSHSRAGSSALRRAPHSEDGPGRSVLRSPGLAGFGGGLDMADLSTDGGAARRRRAAGARVSGGRRRYERRQCPGAARQRRQQPVGRARPRPAPSAPARRGRCHGPARHAANQRAPRHEARPLPSPRSARAPGAAQAARPGPGGPRDGVGFGGCGGAAPGKSAGASYCRDRPGSEPGAPRAAP